MDVRFVDHPRFQKAALRAGLGGAALAAIAPAALVLPAAAFGCALGLALDEDRRRRLPAAVLCGVAAGFSAAMPKAGWPWLLCGALLSTLLASAQAAEKPSWGLRALTAFCCGVAAWVAARVLPDAASVFASAVPAVVAYGAAGATLGLWFVLAAAPLHVRIGADSIEARLAALRPSLTAEARTLAERAATARRGALGELGARADLRSLIDSLCGAAIDLAARA